MEIAETTKITDLITKNFFGQEISRLLKNNGQEYFRDDSNLSNELLGLRGEKKLCFKNCTDLAFKYSQLTYVEGYAYASMPIPINHAWLITNDGQVVDPTWDVGSNYFGIPFKTVDLAKALQITKSYGIINQLWLHKELIKQILSQTT